MPIHSGDVKLLKSAVMADVPDGCSSILLTKKCCNIMN